MHNEKCRVFERSIRGALCIDIRRFCCKKINYIAIIYKAGNNSINFDDECFEFDTTIEDIKELAAESLNELTLLIYLNKAVNNQPILWCVL